MNRKSLWQFLKDVFTQWIDDDPFLLASSLSYYTLFSLAPLLIIAIAVAGFAFGREAAQNQIVETIGGMIGPESAKAIQGMIENAGNKLTTGVVSALIGAVALMVGAGGVCGQLQTSLNKVWEVEPKPNQGILGFHSPTICFFCHGFRGGFSPPRFSCSDGSANGLFASSRGG